MASDKKFMDYIVEQIDNAGEITYKSMFGEYGVFSDGKIFALVCDNKLFVKPTEGGREFIRDVVEAPPYPGAKPSFLIEEKIDNREWISDLERITVKIFQRPKLKRRKGNNAMEQSASEPCTRPSSSLVYSSSPFDWIAIMQSG